MKVCSKAFDNLGERCFDIGRQIAELERENTDLQSRVFAFEQQVREFRERITEIDHELAEISSMEAAIRAASGRHPGTAIIGEVSIEVIRLARQKDGLEQERLGAENALSRLEPSLQQAERRLDNVDHLLSRLRDDHRRNGCAASTIPF